MSPNPVLRQVYKRHVVEMPSDTEGYRRVLTDKFAYVDLYESAVFHTPCNIIDIKKDYFKHMVALGFQKGSPYRTFINFQ